MMRFHLLYHHFECYLEDFQENKLKINIWIIVILSKKYPCILGLKGERNTDQQDVSAGKDVCC